MAEIASGTVVMGARLPRSLHAKIVAEQQRVTKLTGIKPSLNEVVQMLLERGLKNGKRHGTP